MSGIFGFRREPLEPEIALVRFEANTGEEPVVIVNADQPQKVARLAIRAAKERLLWLPGLQVLAEVLRRLGGGCDAVVAAATASLLSVTAAGGAVMAIDPVVPPIIPPAHIHLHHHSFATLERVAAFRPGAPTSAVKPTVSPRPRHGGPTASAQGASAAAHDPLRATPTPDISEPEPDQQGPEEPHVPSASPQPSPSPSGDSSITDVTDSVIQIVEDVVSLVK